MKLSIFALVAAILGGSISVASAQTTLTFRRHIDTGGDEVTPIGITSDGTTNVYVAGFSQRRVLKLTDFDTATPVLSVLTRTSSADAPAGPVTWNASTGLFTADFKAPDQLLVAGDTFDNTNGGAAIVIDADDGTVVSTSYGVTPGGEPGPIRHAGAVWYGTTDIVAQFQAGTNYWQITGTNFASAGFYGGPAASASRDMAVSANGTIYISRNGAFVGADTETSIHRIIDTGSNFALAGNSNEPNWYTTTRTATGGASQGITVGVIDGVESVALCMREDAKIVLMPTTAATVAPATPETLTDAELTNPADATVVTKGGRQYLLVTQYGRASAPTSCVSVFELNATSTNDWQSYN